MGDDEPRCSGCQARGSRRPLRPVEPAPFAGTCASGIWGSVSTMSRQRCSGSAWFSSIIRLLRARSYPGEERWTFSAIAGDVTLVGEAIAPDPRQVALASYADTDGSHLSCRNSKTATLRIRLRDPDRGIDATLVASGRGVRVRRSRQARALADSVNGSFERLARRWAVAAGRDPDSWLFPERTLPRGRRAGCPAGGGRCRGLGEGSLLTRPIRRDLPVSTSYAGLGILGDSAMRQDRARTGP